MKIFIKNNIFSAVLIFICFGLVHWYLFSQQVIPDIAISFYHKYANFNQLADNSLVDGLKALFESVQTDSRNLIFAFILRPFWLIFGKSFDTYISGIYLIFFVPTMVICYRFINKFVLENCKEFGSFKKITKILLFTMPIFLYTLVIGYPDILSIGFAILGVGSFFRANITQETDFKNLILSTVFFFLAFLFRRWLFFVWVSFVLTSVVFYTFKIATIKNHSAEERFKKFIYLIKNIAIIVIIFFTFFFVFANNVLFDMFNPQFRQLFQDYAVSFSQNFLMVCEWGNNCIYAVLAVYILFFSKTSRKIQKFFSKRTNDFENNSIDGIYEENLSKRNDIFSFFFLNSVVYFVIFSYVNIICYDHLLWLVLCGFICFVIALYSIFMVIPFKKFFTFVVILIAITNLFFAVANTSIRDNHIFKLLFISKKIEPKTVPNFEILKETENIIREKFDKNPKFRYSMWCFWNDIFNPHLIFQSAYDTDLFNAGIFPPLVDTEVIVSNWYSFEIFKVDTIFVLDPIQNYLEDANKCKILSNTQELLKNKQGFGAAFDLTEKKYFGEYNGQKVYVFQYDRIRPVTKSDQDDYYNRIIEWYPWAKEYFPQYFENSWQNKD